MQGIVTLMVAARDWLARVASLRWARIGGLDLVVPAAAGLVVFNAIPQLGRGLWGVPFWLAWIVTTAIAAAALLAWSRGGRPGSARRFFFSPLPGPPRRRGGGRLPPRGRAPGPGEGPAAPGGGGPRPGPE